MDKKILEENGNFLILSTKCEIFSIHQIQAVLVPGFQSPA